MKIAGILALILTFGFVAYVALNGVGLWGMAVVGALLVAGLANEIRLCFAEASQ